MIRDEKIPCPVHGVRTIRVQHYNGPGGSPRSEWHRCTRCEFKRWVSINLWIIIGSTVLVGAHVQNVLVYLHVLR